MRYAVGIEYDGGVFMGWQRQSHAGRTVQAAVEDALAKVAAHAVDTVCAGRTDAGVHALGQVVHFDTDSRRSERGWLLGLNSNLPAEVAVNWIRAVPEDFHARYRALARHYRYIILNRLTRPALERTRCTWVHALLDAERMQEAAQALLGEHDFSAYRAAECQARSPMRTVHRITVGREGERVVLDITANGFLHHMVRNIAGVLIAVGQGRRSADWPRAVLEGRDRRLGGVTAPAAGLCFTGVLYPARFEIPLAERAPFEGLSANL